MCRHAAYLGPPVSLETFLLRPSHSLASQSYRPREMLTAELNADGFGFGWYLPDGAAANYTNPMPIWSDANLASLGPALVSGAWIGNVRSATPGLPVNQANTHPFRQGRLMFSHNGFITDFAHTLRRTLREFLAPAFDTAICGNTDSEHIFGLLLQELGDGAGDADRLGQAMRRTIEKLSGWLGDLPALLNFLVTDGDCVIASRHALNHDSPSLYYGRDTALFGAGWLVASEPLTDDGEWTAVPDRHLVTLQAGTAPCLSAV